MKRRRLCQFELNAEGFASLNGTPKAFANFSPGLLQPWGEQQQPGVNAESVGKLTRLVATLG